MKTLDIRMNIVLDDDALEQLKQIVREALSPTREEQSRDRRIKASQHANLGGKELPTDKGLLVDTKQAAKLVGVSTRTISKMEKCGEMPKAIRIGHAVRWSYEELQAWVSERCPKRAPS